MMDLANSGLGQRINAAAGISRILSIYKQSSDLSIPLDRYREAKEILRALMEKDPDQMVRAAAVKSAAKLGDKDDIPILRKIADSDTASYAAPDGLTRYPVREAATMALNKIATESLLSTPNK